MFLGLGRSIDLLSHPHSIFSRSQEFTGSLHEGDAPPSAEDSPRPFPRRFWQVSTLRPVVGQPGSHASLVSQEKVLRSLLLSNFVSARER